MEYWTIMLITMLGGPMEGTASWLIYPSEESCITSAYSVTETLPYDYTISCNPTDVPSKSIKPKRKP